MLFFTHEAAMKNQQDQNADRYRRVGNIEDWPTRKMIPEDVHIKEIYVDEIYDLAIKQSPIVEQHAVEDPVDKIADCAAKDHCKRESEKEPFIPHLVEVEQDADTRNDGKDREEQFPADVDAESHAGVLDIRKARKVPEDRDGSTERHPFNMDTEHRYRKSLNEQLRDLVPHDDEQRYE